MDMVCIGINQDINYGITIQYYITLNISIHYYYYIHYYGIHISIGINQYINQ